jgi:L-lactate dehydrogenase (cytochrome)
MSAYGVPGVEKCLDLLKEELEMVMRLMGVTSLKQVYGNADLLHTSSLNVHVGHPPTDYLAEESYQPLLTAWKPTAKL